MKYLTFFLALSMVLSCSKQEVILKSSVEIATDWAELSTYITQHTPSNSPTFASRCFGYIGLTMYESIVHGYPQYKSMVLSLNGLQDLPLPEMGKDYNWDLVLNAGQAEILRNIYIQTADSNKVKIDSLEEVILYGISSGIKDKKIVSRSEMYGRQIAGAIFEWSKTDGGHRGYLNNFDKKLIFPEFPGSWKPPLYAQAISRNPLHPHWGKNRTFALGNRQISDPEMIPYDTLQTSEYYQQFLDVYHKEKTLSQEEKKAAIWWGDDPDVTFTPPGHSYYLATLAIKSKKPSLIESAATYAKVGMAVADAFIKCWEWKYKFFSERPNTFIPQFIDQEWESFWPDPPFPSFPSGHAIQAASTATILREVFGDTISLIDSSHVGRARDNLRDVDFVAREFDSFWDVALETAESRFYGGIHTQQDNDVGLEQGQIIADNILKMPWRN